MHILNEYIDYHAKYTSLYHTNTVIMMEVGSFFELYAIPDETSETGFMGANIYTICDLLNIQVTKRNKSIAEVNKDNFLMAGFPNHSVKKYIDILVDNKFVVVLVEQVSQAPKIVRKPTHVYSPSTHVDNLKTHHTNYMMSIYIEKLKSKNNEDIYMTGWSLFDPSTGTSYAHETTTEKDYKLLLDELYRVVLKYDPKELVLISLENSGLNSREIYSYLGDGRHCLNKLNSMDDMYTKLKFQKAILKKVFPSTGMLSEIEYIHMEFKPFALVSYVYLVQFAFEHNENFIKEMDKPIITSNENNRELVLAYNATSQLNIIGGAVSIESIFNNCVTSIGKRFFKERLLYPIYDSQELMNRYSKTKIMYDAEAWEHAKDLSTVKDIERLLRKGTTQQLHPHHFACLYDSICSLHGLFEKLSKNESVHEAFLSDYDMDVNESSIFERFEKECSHSLIMNEVSKYSLENIKTNMFKKGFARELDELYDKSGVILDSFKSKLSLVEDQWLKLDYNDREGYFFTMTSKRWALLKSKKHSLTNELEQCGSVANQFKLSNTVIKKQNTELREIELEAKQLSVVAYQKFIHSLMNGFGECLFKRYIHLLEDVDLHMCCAKNVKTFNLCMPVIEEREDSYFSFEEVRHPIVEHVQKDIRYTSNSLRLGEEERGLILYGVNAAGKSSFMKSIGVNLIMAQAGMFVSSRRMVFSPYKKLFTRILSSDSIVKGMSTFANEIYEIRNILEKVDSCSLVIGDELCSGTESVSAISIIMSGIESLVKAKSTFIFATHLHELNRLSRLQKLQASNTLYVKHLKVVYDEKNDVLVYDRKLADGGGNALYGLEVCKAMDMKAEFIHTASMIRRELLNESNNMCEPVTSKYNSRVIVQSCAICGGNQNLETHHLRMQKDSDSYGNIDGTFHKNAQFNLLPLCDTCHDKVHDERIDIQGWKQTTNGPLLFKDIKNEPHYNIDDILEIRKTNSIRNTIKLLKETKSIHLSEYKLKKLLKEHT